MNGALLYRMYERLAWIESPPPHRRSERASSALGLYYLSRAHLRIVAQQMLFDDMVQYPHGSFNRVFNALFDDMVQYLNALFDDMIC